MRRLLRFSFALLVAVIGAIPSACSRPAEATRPEENSTNSRSAEAPRPKDNSGNSRSAGGINSAGPTKYALLVGVNEYDHDDLKKLQFAEADATGLKEVLENTGYKVTALTGKNATKAKIESALKGLVKKFERGDTLLVGLAGHGLQFEGEKDSYYCPVDARPFQNKADTLVSVKWVYDRLHEEAAAGAKFLLVDACRNDPKSGRGRGIDADSTPNPPRGVGVLLSCSAGEISWEHESFGSGHGAFFHQVIEGFKGKAKDDEGQVTWDSLRAYVKREVVREVPKIIKGGAKQTPEESGRLSGTPPVLVARDLGSIREGSGREPEAGEERSFEIAAGVKMVFCYIPAGESQLGSPQAEQDYITKTSFGGNRPDFLDTETESKRGKFKTKGFWFGKYAVTQAEWQAAMGDNPSEFDGKKNNVAKGLDTRRFPVENVSWNDCQKFLEKVNGRGGVAKAFGQAGMFALPHEDQWEYACRGGRGNQQAFYFGNELNGKQANCLGDYKGRTTEVGSYAAKYPQPWGLCDMHGNVYQWCCNKFELSDNYVLRGGSWDHQTFNCRSARRIWGESGVRHVNNSGFRVCFSLEK